MSKFAFIVDDCGVPSYYVKSGKGYKYNDNQLLVEHSACFSNSTMIGMWSYPFIFDGCFLNWSEWGDSLPDYELETIIVAIEKNFDLYNVKKLRDKYPNAVIIGMIKEIFVGHDSSYGPTANFESDKHKKRIEFLNQCDAIIQPFPKLEESPITHLINDCSDKNIVYVPFPVDVDYIYDKFYKEDRIESIFVYATPIHGRRANTLEFSKYISDKYGIPYYEKPKQTNEFNVQLNQFYESWSKCTFHFNLDPVDWFPGSQAVQVASAGVINVGGLNASHNYLFPELATNDTNILETKINKIITDQQFRIDVMTYAFNKVHELYSFDTVRKQIESILS